MTWSSPFETMSLPSFRTWWTTPANTPKSSSNFHKQIITALEKQDPDAAQTAMEQDLIQGGAALLTYFENQPS